MREFSDTNDLAWLLERLPPIEPFQTKAEADFYGASWEIAKQISANPTPIETRASWVHAWKIEPNFYPGQISTIPARKQRHLVGSQAQADLLEKAGYSDVHAVGTPYIYAKPLPADRVPRSLLVMPTHALPHTIHDFNEDLYASEIANLKDQFDVIVACISGNCLDRGMWYSAFERQGIPWIRGAKLNDRNALSRMATLFSTFDCVTTHVLGSHVAYAGYSGCRVSIYGTYNHLPHEAFIYDANLNTDSRMLDEHIRKLSLAFVKENFAHLLCHPSDGYDQQSWFAQLLGEQCRQSPEHLAKLLNWQPSWGTYLRTWMEWTKNDLLISSKRLKHRMFPPTQSATA